VTRLGGDHSSDVEVDLSGVMYGMEAALPRLDESAGCVINTASIYGLVGGKGAASYSAAEGGVVNLTQQVATTTPTKGSASGASARASSTRR
jgi:meso-butanediol dehydrogenase/(S,S)-butanediol dehydrogenase/diacetyl reductase